MQGVVDEGIQVGILQQSATPACAWFETKQICKCHWVDTRDMVVDGLTKGMKDRSALMALMQGVWQSKHKVETHTEA